MLLMPLLGMDLYMDLDLEDTLDEVVVGELGREGMLDRGVVDKRIVLMDKLLPLHIHPTKGKGGAPTIREVVGRLCPTIQQL